MSSYFCKSLLPVIILALLFFITGCTSNSNLAKEPSSQFQDSNSTSKASLKEIMEEAKSDLKKWPDRLWNDSKATFTKNENIAALLVVGGASIVMNQGTDDEIKEYFDKYDKFHNWKDESLYILGSPTAHFTASSIWYYLSARDRDTVNKERAWTMRTALTITWLTTAALKTARNNDTPNGKNRAWPSGHTSSSFTLASVLDEYYGPKVGIPAYVFASLVGYRMMDTGDHWGSDVVFGATLGWVVGHTVAGQDKDHKIAGFEIVPFVPETEKPALGIGLVKRF